MVFCIFCWYLGFASSIVIPETNERAGPSPEMSTNGAKVTVCLINKLIVSLKTKLSVALKVNTTTAADVAPCSRPLVHDDHEVAGVVYYQHHHHHHHRWQHHIF